MGIEEFAKRFIQAQKNAWQDGDYTELEELEHHDVVYHTLAFGDLVGFQAHMDNIEFAKKAASDIHQEWDYVTGDGNLFVLSYKSRVKAAREIPEMDVKAGVTRVNDYFLIVRLQGGKIAEVWFKGSSTIE